MRKGMSVVLVAAIISCAVFSAPKPAYAGDGTSLASSLVYVASAIGVVTLCFYAVSTIVDRGREKIEVGDIRKAQKADDARLVSRFDSGVGRMKYAELLGAMGAPTHEAAGNLVRIAVCERADGTWNFTFDKGKDILTRWSFR